MIELFLMRHGETNENKIGVLQGIMASSLSPLGIEQAHNTGKTLPIYNFDILLSSPLYRAIQTAKIVQQYIDLPIMEEPLLQERDWGEITGKKIIDIDRNNLPKSVETMFSVYKRAEAFLQKIVEKYDEKKVLVITHGLFMRALIALYTNQSKKNVPRVSNVEIRKIIIQKPLPKLSIKDLEEMVSSN